MAKYPRNQNISPSKAMSVVKSITAFSEHANGAEDLIRGGQW